MKSANYYETEDYILFYGSCYSQWAMRDIEIDNQIFNCCEQYMMSEKARLFNDNYAYQQIMEAKDPAVQKSWGKQVKNFDKDEWEKIARDVVYKANYAKFTQHEDLKMQLLGTGDKVIVEASPTDRIWGIGLGCLDPRALEPSKWRGTNWLGQAIMKVRDNIRNNIGER